jgi:3-phenylpropionate/trans-cinnamate dioxygenase ferredoxin subunit
MKRDETVATQFERLVHVREVPMGKLVRVSVKGNDILLCGTKAGVFAVSNRCSHMNAPLHEGRLMGNRISCPLHGGEFLVTSGAPVAFPASSALQTFPVRIVEEWIEVDCGK